MYRKGAGWFEVEKVIYLEHDASWKIDQEITSDSSSPWKWLISSKYGDADLGRISKEAIHEVDLCKYILKEAD